MVWDNWARFKYHLGMSQLTIAREAKGLSRKQLGDEVRLSETQIGRLENGTRAMTDEVASRLAAVLEVTPLTLKPDFAKHVIAGLSPKNRQKFFDHLETLFVVESVEKRRANP